MRITARKLRGPLLAAGAVALLVGCASTGAKTVATVSPTRPTTRAAAPHPGAEPLVCPTALPTPVAAAPIVGTSSVEVPGSPDALLACRYHGLNQPERAGSVAASKTMAPGPIATALNGAAVIPKGAGYSCPNSTGETILLIFRYGDVTMLEVSVPTSGCTFADNGDRVVQTPAAVLTQLETALGHDSTP